MKAYKNIELKLGKKYRIGLPGGESWKSKTPSKLKNFGEGLVLVGGLVTLAIGSLTPPAWVVYAGGAATLVGRFLIKCVSGNN